MPQKRKGRGDCSSLPTLSHLVFSQYYYFVLANGRTSLKDVLSPVTVILVASLNYLYKSFCTLYVTVFTQARNFCSFFLLSYITSLKGFQRPMTKSQSEVHRYLQPGWTVKASLLRHGLQPRCRDDQALFSQDCINLSREEITSQRKFIGHATVSIRCDNFTE